MLDFLNYLKDHKAALKNLIFNNPEIKGFIVRQLYVDALQYVSEKGYKLNNIWNYFGSKPIGAYKEYFRKIH